VQNICTSTQLLDLQMPDAQPKTEYKTVVVQICSWEVKMRKKAREEASERLQKHGERGG